MNNSASRLTVGVATLLFLGAGAGAQTETPPTGGAAEAVPAAMHEFLHGWLVEQDRSKALSYFSMSERAMRLAPDRVWEAGASEAEGKVAEYRAGTWEMINSVWWARRNAQKLGDALEPMSDELMQAFGQELEVDVISQAEKVPFLVYVAWSEESIDSFDGAHKDAFNVLKPKERTTLGLLADVVRSDDAHGVASQNAGPFVSFWQEEPEGWRIQMVGAILP